MKHIYFVVLATLFAFSSYGSADSLTLHFYPSPHGINWSSPQRLTFSTAINLVTKKDKGYRRIIGHASIELQCDATQDREAVHIWRGASSAFGTQLSDRLRTDKYGLGILFYNLDGRFEKNRNLEEKTELRLMKGRNSFIEYAISPETCKRLHEYSLEYEEREYWRHYGLPNRPRHGEGAGCTAFVVSYLSLAGILEPEYYDGWSKSVRVPLRLIGGHYTDRKVSIFRLLTTSLDWAKEHEAHYPLFFWDPDAMHRWVKRVHKNDGVVGNLKFEPVRYFASKGLRLDVRDAPTPTDPFFHVQG